LGDYTYAMGDNQIAHAVIGKFVNIATNARINPPNHPTWRATQHHFTYRSYSYGLSLDDDQSIFEWRAQDRVEIGHDVWLGHGAIIMPGVKVGTGAVVGSGAIVTKDVPPFAIVVGVPARVLRMRVDEKTAERLQRIAWWDWSPERIDAALTDFRTLSAEAFAEKYDV
jgi:phosphonate metabolism protein (transferase hexapeptide repeat family)